MTTEHFEPQAVRAWAEYPEWSVYWQHLAKLESAWFIPTGADGLAYNLGPMPLASMIEGQSLHGYTLRSLRVLFDTGHTLKLDHEDSEGDVVPYLWFWWLFRPEFDFTTVGGRVDGIEFTDTEAVERALAEAGRWIKAQEGER